MSRKKNDASFLSRIILFFRWLKRKLNFKKAFKKLSDRQKSLSSYSNPNASEESRLSYSFGMAKTVSIILLVSLLVVTLMFGSSVISYDKIYYMFKDIGYIHSFDEGTPNELSYSKPVQNQAFHAFKNGLLVASDSEIKMFTSTGRVTMTEGSDFTNPRISTSKGYALIYDQGRKLFSVYNSFVKLYSENTDYAISNADMADNGCFLVVTSSKKYNSVVQIYDGSLNKISEYSKNSYVVSASLSSDGRYAAILSLSAVEGTGITILDVIDCKKNTVISETSFEGYMPYICEFLTDDDIAVFLDEKVCSINKNGKMTNEYHYPSNAEKIEIAGDKFVMLFSEVGLGESKTLEIFDSKCNNTFSKKIDGNVKDIALANNFVYVLKSRELLRISTSIGAESRTPSSADNSQIVLFSNGGLVLCSQNAATYISFD